MVQLVGVLNVTPDSFSDGGLFLKPEAAISQAKKLFAEGAAMVDVGAESTRPGSAGGISTDEEWRRLEPVLKQLLMLYPGKISVDTHHPETVEKVLALGDAIINDVTGMNNPAMVEVVASHKAGCIISHLPAYADIYSVHEGKLMDNVEQVVKDLLGKAEILQAKGLKKQQIILDPGIGFGKTQALNEKLLKFAQYVPDYKVMIGYSKKRFLGKHRMELETNLAAGRVAIAAGAAFLRVHDVAGHRQLLA